MYRIPDLEPGRYSVTVELPGFQKVQADDVLVLLGRTADFTATLKVGGVSEVVTVSGRQRKHQPAEHDGRAQRNGGRNRSHAEGTQLPGHRADRAGRKPGRCRRRIPGQRRQRRREQFTVDGVTTNSLLSGSSRQDTVFEYLQEVQVKTGGIAAEYGGALGGVISAVTKSGGNPFTARATITFRAIRFRRTQFQRLQLSPLDDTTVLNVQDTKQKNNRSEVGGSIGGPIMKDHLFFFGSVSPRFIPRRTTICSRTAPSRDPFRSRRPSPRAFGRVTASTEASPGEHQRPTDTPLRFDRRNLGLRRHRPELHQQLAGR